LEQFLKNFENYNKLKGLTNVEILENLGNIAIKEAEVEVETDEEGKFD
jgi:hypothetical protein